jgi:hypothetical protein
MPDYLHLRIHQIHNLLHSIANWANQDNTFLHCIVNWANQVNTFVKYEK